MEIGKIALTFVILGLATCGADRCDEIQLKIAIKPCLDAEMHVKWTYGQDHVKLCSDLETIKGCYIDKLHGCYTPFVATLKQRLEQSSKDLGSRCPGFGYSHASSTSVVNIALLIASATTFMPFL